MSTLHFFVPHRYFFFFIYFVYLKFSMYPPLSSLQAREKVYREKYTYTREKKLESCFSLFCLFFIFSQEFNLLGVFFFDFFFFFFFFFFGLDFNLGFYILVNILNIHKRRTGLRKKILEQILYEKKFRRQEFLQKNFWKQEFLRKNFWSRKFLREKFREPEIVI